MECEIKRDRMVVSFLQFEATAIMKDLERVKSPSSESEELYKRMAILKERVKRGQ